MLFRHDVTTSFTCPSFPGIANEGTVWIMESFPECTNHGPVILEVYVSVVGWRKCWISIKDMACQWGACFHCECPKTLQRDQPNIVDGLHEKSKYFIQDNW